MSFFGTCGLRVMYIETGGMSCRLSVLHRYFPQRAVGHKCPTYFTASLTVIPAQAGMTGTGIKCRGRLKIFSDGLLVCFIAMHCFNQQCTSVPSFSPVTTCLSEPCLAMPKTTMLSLRSRQRAKAVASMTLRFLCNASSKVMVS